MTTTAEFSPDEWRTLQFAPFWIFSSLVGAYRDFDPAEFDVFSRSLDRAAGAPGRLSREVVASVQADLGWLRDQYECDSRTIAGGLCAVSDALARVPIAEAQMFKEALVGVLGRTIATARGPFGQVATVECLQMLRMDFELLSEMPAPLSAHPGAA